MSNRKKETTYDVFARVTVNDNSTPEQVAAVLQRACESNGWDFSSSIEPEDDGTDMKILTAPSDDDY